MVRISGTGLVVRAVATVLGMCLLLAGTMWGTDDHFPFGPFRMFAGVNGTDEDAPDLRVEGTDVAGRTVLLDQRATGIRRAEVEENRDRYVGEPAGLSVIADAYRRLHPDAARLTEVRIVVRWHEIRASRPTGRYRDETVALWRVP